MLVGLTPRVLLLATRRSMCCVPCPSSLSRAHLTPRAVDLAGTALPLLALAAVLVSCSAADPPSPIIPSQFVGNFEATIQDWPISPSFKGSGVLYVDRSQSRILVNISTSLSYDVSMLYNWQQQTPGVLLLNACFLGVCECTATFLQGPFPQLDLSGTSFQGKSSDSQFNVFVGATQEVVPGLVLAWYTGVSDNQVLSLPSSPALLLLVASCVWLSNEPHANPAEPSAALTWLN